MSRSRSDLFRSFLDKGAHFREAIDMTMAFRRRLKPYVWRDREIAAWRVCEVAVEFEIDPVLALSDVNKIGLTVYWE